MCMYKSPLFFYIKKDNIKQTKQITTQDKSQANS